MSTPDTPQRRLPLTPYGNARAQLAESAAHTAEVPLEHYVCPPLPTGRWGEPAYAVFAAPAVRAPRQPMRIAPPDRWWAVGISNPRLLAYALVSVAPFTATPLGDPVTVPSGGRRLSAVREDQRLFDSLMDRALPLFLAGDADSGDADLRADLSAVLGLVLPAECRAWSRALTPDFYAWLEQ
ncbi:hypothetical protein ACF09E_01335 [Streptomyces sp. NPDC014891]|uniref:hypothetical protein n=1 Tax=Streptomyces sp. NPDC014891 TaxID=3364929 RepID=UPI0036FB2EE2